MIPAGRVRYALSLSIALLAVFGEAVCARDLEVIEAKARDAEMDAAIFTARSKLDEFLALQLMPPQGADRFEVKVRFPVRVYGEEHMWVSPFRPTPRGFEGTLTSRPRLRTDLTHGQTVVFTKEQISDWGYRQDDRRKGHYTTCLLLTRDGSAEAAKLLVDLSLECKP